MEAPDWNPDAICGGGLHCLPEAQGDYHLLSGHYWAVIEFDEADMVMIDTLKCKVKKCKIVFLSENTDGLLQYFDINKFNSKTAYKWARNIGNKDIMIDRITESQWAYYWAKNIGNQDVMINKITDSIWAYCWAINIGSRHVIMTRFPEWADKLYSQ